MALTGQRPSSPLVAGALDIAREHARFCAYHRHRGTYDSLNDVMVAIDRPRLVTFGWTDRPIRLAALAAEWLALRAAYK